MHIRRMFFITFFVLLSSVGAQAQQVSRVGLGLRLNPDGAGFTGKFFLDRNWAIEAQVNGSQGFFRGPEPGAPRYGPSVALVGLLEYHIVLNDPSWRLYFGPGMHVGSWDMYHHHKWDNYRDPQPIFGIDGIFGVEYVFKKVPIGISADVKPAMNFVSDVGFFPNNIFGISGRYYLGHRMPSPPKPPAR